MTETNGVYLPPAAVDAILEGSLVQTRLLVALLKYHSSREMELGEPIKLSLTQLSRCCNMHRESVLRAVEEADQAGWLSVERDASGNRYYIEIPAE